MRFILSRFSAKLILMGLLLCAPVPAMAQQATVPKVPHEKYTLPNGLQVILHVDRKLPVVHVNQWIHVGSKNERIGRSGFAHLFEHLMFQGSKNAEDRKSTRLNSSHLGISYAV